MIATVLNSKDPNLKKYGLSLVRVSGIDCSNQCNSCKGCGVFLKSSKPSSTKDILVKDPKHLSSGSIVNVELEDGAILKTSFFLFFIPLMIFFLFLSIGMLFRIHTLIIFSVSLISWVIFYLYLKNVFKYKTYYFITEIKNETVQ